MKNLFTALAIAGVFVCSNAVANPPPATTVVATTSDAPAMTECTTLEACCPASLGAGAGACAARFFQRQAVGVAARTEILAGFIRALPPRCQPGAQSEAARVLAGHPATPRAKAPPPAHHASSASAPRPPAHPAATVEDLATVRGQVAAIDARIATLEARETLTAEEHQLLRDLRTLRDEVVAGRGASPNLAARLAVMDARADRLQVRLDEHGVRIGRLERVARRGFRQVRAGVTVGSLGPDHHAVVVHLTPVLVMGRHFAVHVDPGIGFDADNGGGGYVLAIAGGVEIPFGDDLAETRFALGAGAFDREFHEPEGDTVRRFWGGYLEVSLMQRLSEVRPGRFTPGLHLFVRPELGTASDEQRARRRFGISGGVNFVAEWP